MATSASVDGAYANGRRRRRHVRAGTTTLGANGGDKTPLLVVNPIGVAVSLLVVLALASTACADEIIHFGDTISVSSGDILEKAGECKSQCSLSCSVTVVKTDDDQVEVVDVYLMNAKNYDKYEDAEDSTFVPFDYGQAVSTYTYNTEGTLEPDTYVLVVENVSPQVVTITYEFELDPVDGLSDVDVLLIVGFLVMCPFCSGLVYYRYYTRHSRKGHKALLAERRRRQAGAPYYQASGGIRDSYHDNDEDDVDF